MTVETTKPTRRSVRRRSGGERGPHVISPTPETHESPAEVPARSVDSSWLFAVWVMVSIASYLAFMVGGRLIALMGGWRGG